MSAGRTAAEIVICAGMLAAIGIWTWWQVTRQRPAPTYPQVADDDCGGTNAVVAPWADLVKPQRGWPVWLDDPTAYQTEFLDIADELADSDPAFAEAVGIVRQVTEPEESQ